MEISTIQTVVKMRLAVYVAGCKKGLWNSLDDNGAREMMNYIFPKTGGIAYYNLVNETMKNKHAEYVPAGEYSLFKLPVQFEEEILAYLKSNPDDALLVAPEDPIAYLEAQATIVCSPSLGPIFIGAIKDSGIDTVLKICAFHYLNIFNENTTSYPYFE